MGFPLVDQPSTDISRYFYIASKFIENGINSGGKKVRRDPGGNFD
jgi:atypical dual specificity phosphatase